MTMYQLLSEEELNTLRNRYNTAILSCTCYETWCLACSDKFELKAESITLIKRLLDTIDVIQNENSALRTVPKGVADPMLARIIEAEAENKRLREALEWYETDRNYCHFPAYKGGPMVTPEILSDKGARARVALRKAEALKGGE